MYNIIKTTVTISMIQKNTVHNVICTQQIIIIIKKKKSCRQDHICLIVIQSTKLMMFDTLRRGCRRLMAELIWRIWSCACILFMYYTMQHKWFINCMMSFLCIYD